MAVQAGSGREAEIPGTSGGSPTGRPQQLPIFPLNTVALPHAVTPLLIFEPRYRVLFSTLMDGLPGIEEGLVQKESPFAGTRRFGMLYSERGAGKGGGGAGSGGGSDMLGGLASVGTVLAIDAHCTQPDGRILVVTRGLGRFRVERVMQERPVLVCEVEPLPEDGDDGPEARALAEQVAEAFRGVLRLHRKMRRGRGIGGGGSLGASGGGGGLGGGALGSLEAEDEPEEPGELTEYGPAELSYWVASVFGEHPPTQQALLEAGSTLARLARERDVLSSALAYYGAAAALEGAFAGDPPGGAPQPRPGGPD